MINLSTQISTNIIILVLIVLISLNGLARDSQSAKDYNQLAHEQITLGNYLEAYKLANLAREQSIMDNNQVELANALKYIGTSFYLLADYNSALNYYQQSFLIYEQLSDIDNQVRLLSHQANIYSDLNDYSTAIEIEEAAIKLSNQNSKSTPLYHGLFLNYAYDLGKSGAYLQALEEYKKVKPLIENSNELMAYYTIQLAEVHRTHKKSKIAEEVINTAISITKDVFEPLYFDALLEKAKIQIINQQYSKSIALSEQAVEYYSENKRLSKLADAYDVLYKSYENLNQLSKALQYLKEKHRILDETQDIRTQLYAEAIAIERQLDDNRKQINEIRKKQEKREETYLKKIAQLQWAIIIMSLIFTLGLVIIVQRTRVKRQNFE